MPLHTDAKPATGENQRPKNLLSTSYEINQGKAAVTISGNATRLFVERKEFLVGPDEYARNGCSPGLVLIFNQEEFEDKSYRSGSRRDVNEIVTCLGRLGFNISENHIFIDKTRDEILKVVEKIANSDLSQYNSLIIFFLTHGDGCNILHAYDRSLQGPDLWKAFSNCKNLENKPKMFIFQACKGYSHSTIASDHKDKPINLVPDITFDSNYIGPDMLILYSTTEGNVSFRDPINGSWFIQELCKNFSAYGRRDDVVSLIIRTTKCLCRNYFDDDGRGNLRKQMPIFVSTLRKKFYLNRYKDRNMLYKLIQNQESMQKSIDELKEKVEKLIAEKQSK